MSEKRRFGYLSLGVMLIAGIAIGSYAFPQTEIDTDVVNQTVTIYDIKDIRIEGRCYDRFGDKLGEAKNTRAAIEFSNRKERMRGHIGPVVFRNPVQDIEARHIECPANTTDMELLIESADYEYQVYQAGMMLDKGSGTAQIFEYVDARKDEDGYWHLSGYGASEKIMEEIIDDQPW